MQPDNTKAEIPFVMPIGNPATGHKSRLFVLGGFIDALEHIKRIGKSVIEYKTVGDTGKFIQELSMGFQAEMYVLAIAETTGVTPAEICYRVMQRPGIICTKGKPDNGDWDHYEKRCKEWCLTYSTKGKAHMMDLPKSVNNGRLDTCRQFIWDCCQRIQQNLRQNLWLTSAKSCWKYNKACEFAEVCAAQTEGNDWQSVLDESFHERPISKRLSPLAGGKMILSHSALEALTICEVLFYFRYIRRLTSATEGGEAQRVGSAVHVALAALVTDGPDAPRLAVAKWAEDNPTLGEDDADKSLTEQHKALGMTAAAAEFWNLTEENDNDTNDT